MMILKTYNDISQWCTEITLVWKKTEFISMFLPKLMICVVVMLVKIQSFQDQYIQH